MFSGMLTLSGRVRIEFEQIFANLDYFSGRQKWLTKVFKRLGNLLKEGNINVSHDKMVYHVNIRLMESENIEQWMISDSLRNIEQWMINRQRDNSILRHLREILPEEEIVSLEKATLRSRLAHIHPEYGRLLLTILFYAIFFITILILSRLEPESLDKILGALGKLLEKIFP